MQIKLLIISWTAVAAFALLVRHGMSFDMSSSLAAVGTILLLAPFAVAFENRNVPQFVNLLTGFLCMVAFNAFLSILTYACTPLDAPLADPLMMKCDAALGIHLPSIVEWVRSRPLLHSAFDVVYPSVMFSTLLALVVVGLDPDQRRMQRFVMQFMLAGLVTTVLYIFFPCDAPYTAYGYELNPGQQRFKVHFDALRSDAFPIVSLTNLEGLITFPSFHTSWALLVAWSFRHHRWLFPPMLLLNLAVVASTVCAGWHYGTDVIGGLVVAVGAVLVTRRLEQMPVS